MSFCELGGQLTSLSKGYQSQLLHKQRPTPRASVVTGQQAGLSHASLCPWQKATASPCTSPMTSPHALLRLIKLFICPGQCPTKAPKQKRERGQQGRREYGFKQGQAIRDPGAQPLPTGTNTIPKSWPMLQQNPSTQNLCWSKECLPATEESDRKPNQSKPNRIKAGRQHCLRAQQFLPLSAIFNFIFSACWFRVSRLGSNFLCSWGWLQSLDPPAPAFQVLENIYINKST